MVAGRGPGDRCGWVGGGRVACPAEERGAGGLALSAVQREALGVEHQAAVLVVDAARALRQRLPAPLAPSAARRRPLALAATRSSTAPASKRRSRRTYHRYLRNASTGVKPEERCSRCGVGGGALEAPDHPTRIAMRAAQLATHGYSYGDYGDPGRSSAARPRVAQGRMQHTHFRLFFTLAKRLLPALAQPLPQAPTYVPPPCPPPAWYRPPPPPG